MWENISEYFNKPNFKTKYKNQFKTNGWAIASADSWLDLSEFDLVDKKIDEYVFYFNNELEIIFPIKKDFELLSIAIAAHMVGSPYNGNNTYVVEINNETWYPGDSNVDFASKILDIMEHSKKNNSHFKFKYQNNDIDKEIFRYWKEQVFFIVSPEKEDFYFYKKEYNRIKKEVENWELQNKKR